VELFDLVDGVEEDKHLRTSAIFDFLVEVLEDSGNDVFVHFLFGLAYFVVVFDSFQGYLFTKLLLDHLIDVEFYDIFGMFIIELYKLLFHGCRASNHVWSASLRNF